MIFDNDNVIILKLSSTETEPRPLVVFSVGL
jgi:hypothetical protein